jgi:hypothetical protein
MSEEEEKVKDDLDEQETSRDDDDDDTADTSVDDETAAAIIPPGVYLRRSAEEELVSTRAPLSEAQSAALSELRALIDAHPASQVDFKRAWLSDACLLRNLRARNYVVSDAHTLLTGTLTWRDEKAVWTLRDTHVDELSFEMSSGKMYRNGFDLKGRPILYIRDRRKNSDHYENQVLNTISALERLCDTMDLSRGVESWVLLFDFRGYTNANRAPFSMTKEVLSMFLDRYPERLGLGIFVDAPWLFHSLFRLIGGLLPAETKAKVCFVNGTLDEKREQLSKHIDPDVLESMIGGTNNCRYVHKKYYAEETRQHALLVEHEHRLRNPAAPAAAATTTGARKTKSKKKKTKAQ